MGYKCSQRAIVLKAGINVLIILSSGKNPLCPTQSLEWTAIVGMNFLHAHTVKVGLFIHTPKSLSCW